MSARSDTLSSCLARYLARLTPPRDLGELAQQDETAALFRAIDRAAPAAGYEGWWSNFEDALSASLRTRAWPTVGEIVRAAGAVREADRAAQAYGATPVADELGYLRFTEFWAITKSVRRGTQTAFLQRAVKEGVATWGAFRWQGCDIPRWAFEIADRENRALSDAHVAARSESTRPLREQGAPRGDIRRAVA